jgi:hypothetical protein
MHPLKKFLNNLERNQNYKFDGSNDVAPGQNSLKKKKERYGSPN